MLNTNPLVKRIVRLALEEDIGTGDVTTEAVVPSGTYASAEVVAKEDGVLCGLPVAMLVLAEVDPQIWVTPVLADGEVVTAGTVVLRAEGPARSLLVAERTLLDFVMRLSGIATLARKYSQALEGTRTQLLDTRKTTPGLRVLEKYAARIGGARNHRTSLAGGVLVKNNHIACCGDMKEAIRRAKTSVPVLCKIEVEVRTMDEVKRAVEAGADVLLLDHMTQEQVVEVLDYCNWKVAVEVSGNVTADGVSSAAEAGADYVSSGALTHSARWLDFGMYLKVIDARRR